MIKKHTLLALLTSAALSSTALAADLPTKAPAYAPAAAPIWNGFYVGVNVGYGRAKTSSPELGDNTQQGFIGGGQLGYNWQFAPNWVFGVEGDFQGSAQNRSDTVTAFGITGTVDQKLPWFATARARFGYAAGPVLIYATGGAAWSEYKAEVSALGITVSSSATKTSWTAGGGLEWMFAPHWSTKVEYLYIDSGDQSVTLFDVPVHGRVKDNIVRAGLNYHF